MFESIKGEFDILWFIVPKIIVATICGAIIGYDRERRNKVAGIRTNVLICSGSALLTLISIILCNPTLLNDPTIKVDPTRIISTIITGIGFLGGGVIYRSDDKITGVTTAAFIWLASAIGILCGLPRNGKGSFILIPIVLTVGLVFITRIFEVFEKYVKLKKD
jgi:putative Mg2+ transporter-C (MgtC) family protein